MWMLPPSVKIFMANKPVDMRKGYDGLMAIVKNEWQAEIFSGNLFVFMGAAKNRVKILYWDAGGLVLLCKRLEQGRFTFLPATYDDCIELSAIQLAMMLEGIDIRRVKKSTLWVPPQATPRQLADNVSTYAG